MTINSSNPPRWVEKVNQLLTPQRLSYAWLLSGALWLAWLVSIVLGPGNLDLNRQVVGADYIQFYAGGQTLRSGQEARLFDFSYQRQIEAEIAQEEFQGYHAFINPPFLAWLFVPFSILPYPWSFALWSLLGLTGLWFGLRLLGAVHPQWKFAWALTFFPVFASISFGQNSLLSLFLFCLVYALWKRKHLFWAGLAASLLLYKPQLILALGLLWLLEWRQSWRALLGLALGGGALAGLTFLLLPQASQDYLVISRALLPDLAAWEGFPLYNAHMLRAFFILLLPGYPAVSEILAVGFSAMGVAGFVLFWKQNRNNLELLFAAMVCLTIWIIPHAMVYDWALLLIPAIFLWDHQPGLRRGWRALFAILWLAILLSGPLILAQHAVVPFAVQISLPVFAWVLYTGFQLLKNSPYAVSSI